MRSKKLGLALAILWVPLVVVGSYTIRVRLSSYHKEFLILWFCNVFSVPMLGIQLVLQGLCEKDAGVISHIKEVVWRITAKWKRNQEKKGVWVSFTCFIIFLSALNFTSSAFYFVGLRHASVTALQALIQLKSAFTILITWVLLRQKVSIVNVAAVVISLAGVALFVLSVSNDSTRSLDELGVICGLGEALGIAFYGIVVTTFFNSFDFNASITTLFLFGWATIFPGCLFLVLSHYAGFEVFTLPDSSYFWESLCLVAFISVSINLSYLGAVALVGPIPTNIIGVFRIAVSAVVDDYMFGLHMTSSQWVGCAFITAGFLLSALGGTKSRNAITPRNNYDEPFISSFSKRSESIN